MDPDLSFGKQKQKRPKKRSVTSIDSWRENLEDILEARKGSAPPAVPNYLGAQFHFVGIKTVDHLRESFPNQEFFPESYCKQ